MLAKQEVRCILLDIMLPKMDGFTFCAMVRKQWDVAILIMSARSQKSDKLMGYEAGADDYMEKPVDPDILSAKIKALLQRRLSSSIITCGNLELDEEAHCVRQNNQLLDVNMKEYELLAELMRHKGKTLRKEYLFYTIWGADSDSEQQTLTVHIKRLRKKIEEDPCHPKRIITVWGVGYRLEE